MWQHRTGGNAMITTPVLSFYHAWSSCRSYRKMHAPLMKYVLMSSCGWSKAADRPLYCCAVLLHCASICTHSWSTSPLPC